MSRWLDGCERALTMAAVGATFGMMLLTAADAGGRYLLNRPILAAYELTTTYLMVSAIFLAMPYAYRQGANIRVTFLSERLGGAARRAVNHLVQLISALYGTALVLATLQQTYNMMVTRTMLVTMELPQWPGHLVVSIGLFLAAVMMLLDLGQVRKGRSGLFREG